MGISRLFLNPKDQNSFDIKYDYQKAAQFSVTVKVSCSTVLVDIHALWQSVFSLCAESTSRDLSPSLPISIECLKKQHSANKPEGSLEM